MFRVLKEYPLLSIFVILLAVAPTIALNARNMNLWLILFMSISPIFLLVYSKPTSITNPMIAFVIVFLLVVTATNTEIRWTTLLYSSAFCVYLVTYSQILQSNPFDKDSFVQLLQLLILSYWIVLMIQQFCVLTGLPIFNVRQYSPKEPWKLNSLMSEPSHSARIIPVLMYIYVSLKMLGKDRETFKESFHKDRLTWFAFLYSCITMMSATAYIFMLIVLAKFINIKKLLSTVVMVSVVFILVGTYSNKGNALSRSVNIALATMTLDENKIIKADGSGSYRIVPSIRGAKAVEIFSVQGLFGHGIDADVKGIKPMPGTPNGSAGSFTMWYNYGLIIQLFYWILTLRICYIKEDKISLFVWFLCVWMYGGMNNQIIWLTIFLLYTYKYYIQRNNLLI